MYTRCEELIDVHQAELLYTAAREPKQLKIFDHGGHNDIFFHNRTEYLRLVTALLAAV
jgi:fermentation-respiration switch protein FrsA (DUF1100 family)